MSGAGAADQPDEPVEFHRVFKEEIEKGVNARREAFSAHIAKKKYKKGEIKESKLMKAALELEDEESRKNNGKKNNNKKNGDGESTNEKPFQRPTEGSNLVGLALSGGGVRSASFCLGALQALDTVKVLNKVDYLSTVSGGGYTGTAMVAAMSQSKDFKFPFPSELEPEEVPAIQHIRDHSNYLFPGGKIDIFNNLAIYLRGLVANVILILPYLLLAAAATIWFNPTKSALREPNFASGLANYGIQYFGVTLIGVGAFALFLAVWAFARSFWPGKPDIGNVWTRVSGGMLGALLVAAFSELQPVLLDGMFELADESARTEIRAQIMGYAKVVAAVLAPFSAAVGFLSSFMAGVLKKGAENPAWPARIMRVVANSAIYLAAAAVPLILWIAYLYLSFWGICGPGKNPNICLYQAPDWLLHTAQLLPWAGGQPIGLYLTVGLAFFAIQIFLSPNANSLHRLYRDRLSKAFLFDPVQTEKEAEEEEKKGEGNKKEENAKKAKNADKKVERKSDNKTDKKEGEQEEKTIVLKTLDDIKISDVDYKRAPYQIINTALNIQGSKYANQRGRNAEFFVFTPLYTGSEATDYLSTSAMEERTRGLDLAAAMAISGAAASANMGANTIKVLSPTLALVNVRLGFWLPNPSLTTSWFKALVTHAVDQFYFWFEMTGRLREDRRLVYLTDGGHIENLGIYELLRRRCQLIIAIDAEADPDMSFNSFIALQRYALIDLGVLVKLPWAKIRDASRVASAQIAKTGGIAPDKAPQGPHCAIGEIEYPGGGKGALVYIKSSMTGDENDYVVDYKRRYPDFPHETTIDQLFSEEQFEVYRALGFHTTRRAFRGPDILATDPKPVAIRGGALADPAVRAIIGPRRKNRQSRRREPVRRSRKT